MLIAKCDKFFVTKQIKLIMEIFRLKTTVICSTILDKKNNKAVKTCQVTYH